MRARWGGWAPLTVVGVLSALAAFGSGVDLPLGPPRGRSRGAEGVWVPMGREAGRTRDVNLGKQPSLGDNTLGEVFGKFLVVLLVIVAIVLLVIAALWVTRAVRRRAGSLDAAPPVVGLPPFRDEATQLHGGAGVDVALPGRPDDAVATCWARLEEAAAQRGIRRRPTDSSGDLVAAIQRSTTVDGGALRRLERLYLRAVYAGKGITAADATAAETTLTAVLNSWGQR